MVHGYKIEYANENYAVSQSFRIFIKNIIDEHIILFEKKTVF